MKAIIFAPLVGDGAPEFERESRAFAKHHGIPISDRLLFDNGHPMAARRAQVTARAQKERGIEAFVIACHGWCPPGTPQHPVHSTGLQLGWEIGMIHDLAALIKDACVPCPVIPLYCCSVGADNDPGTPEKGPGPGGAAGFADGLRWELLRIGVKATIFAHSTRGPTMRNPYVRRFSPDDTIGGEWVVEPESELWIAWQHALDHTDMRLRFPFMTQEAIEAELRASLHGHAE
jgi:hypothetical protein